MNASIPSELQNTLSRWCEDFAKTLGDALSSIVLFGGLAKGEFVRDRSDVNLLLVFKRIDAAVLDATAPLIRRGRLEFGLSTLLMTDADLRDSADVFPIKFQDMQRWHTVLWGEKNPFHNVTVTREHLRLRCEQELRNLLLRLRQSYVQRAGRSELMLAALSRSVTPLLLNLGVLVELKMGVVCKTKDEILSKVAELDLPLEPIRQASELKHGLLKMDSADMCKLFGSFIETVGKAAEVADKTT